MGDVIVQPSNDSEAIRVLQERLTVIQQKVQLSNAPCTAVALERALQAKRERLAQVRPWAPKNLLVVPGGGMLVDHPTRAHIDWSRTGSLLWFISMPALVY